MSQSSMRKKGRQARARGLSPRPTRGRPLTLSNRRTRRRRTGISRPLGQSTRETKYSSDEVPNNTDFMTTNNPQLGTELGSTRGIRVSGSHSVANLQAYVASEVDDPYHGLFKDNAVSSIFRYPSKILDLLDFGSLVLRAAQAHNYYAIRRLKVYYVPAIWEGNPDGGQDTLAIGVLGTGVPVAPFSNTSANSTSTALFSNTQDTNPSFTTQAFQRGNCEYKFNGTRVYSTGATQFAGAGSAPTVGRYENFQVSLIAAVGQSHNTSSETGSYRSYGSIQLSFVIDFYEPCFVSSIATIQTDDLLSRSSSKSLLSSQFPSSLPSSSGFAEGDRGRSEGPPLKKRKIDSISQVSALTRAYEVKSEGAASRCTSPENRGLSRPLMDVVMRQSTIKSSSSGFPLDSDGDYAMTPLVRD